ncbi:hypothetical protein EV356DRAFT_526693 [Viridothelium virens]|uniref:MFS general substrate transporter n=1 Tax=Viridothelium virens TaxID=1048519 RepID=A0A6A6GY35_VIRVR|nr:hypothetical protein EV356DRAFT_526693 [Viridothelium virens]
MVELPAIVVCDLVPLRERQKHTGIIYGAFAIGTFTGPVVDGAVVDHVGWRWVFWLNLPVAGVALGAVLLFLRVHHDREGSIWTQLLSIDYLDNGILMAGPLSLLSLMLGILGLPGFVFFEASTWCRQPTTPAHLFTNISSAITFALTFLHGAVLEAFPQTSGINTLATAIPLVPFGILGGIWIAKTGRWRLNQLTGFALAAIGIGCFRVSSQHFGTAVWVVLQIIFAPGAGLILTATHRLYKPHYLRRIGDGAYQHASCAFVSSLHRVDRTQVIDTFVASLRLVWEVGSAFAGIGFVIALFVREVELGENPTTKYGYKREDILSADAPIEKEPSLTVTHIR